MIATINSNRFFFLHFEYHFCINMNVERERRRQEASPCGPVECKQTVCQNIEDLISDYEGGCLEGEEIQ